MSSSGTPRMRQAAIAASALSTLCAPGTGSVNIDAVDAEPAGRRAQARHPRRAHRRARRSRNAARRPANGSRFSASPTTSASRARARKRGEHRRDLGHLLVVALEVEDHADRRARSAPASRRSRRPRPPAGRTRRHRRCRAGLAPRSSGRSPPVMTEGSRPAPRRISKTIAVTVDLPLVPVTAIERCRATKCASSSERWTMGMPLRARRGDVGHGVLDRGRDHQRHAVGADAAAVLRQHRDAEPFELGAQARRARRDRRRDRCRSPCRRSSPGTGRARSCPRRRARRSGSGRRPAGRGWRRASGAATSTRSPSRDARRTARTRRRSTGARSRARAGGRAVLSWLVPCR